MPYVVHLNWSDTVGGGIYEEARLFNGLHDVYEFIDICTYIQAASFKITEEEAEECVVFGTKLEADQSLYIYELVGHGLLKSRIVSGEIPEDRMRAIQKFFTNPYTENKSYEVFLDELNDEIDEYEIFTEWYRVYDEEGPDYLCDPYPNWVVRYDIPMADVSGLDWKTPLLKLGIASVGL